MRFLSLLLPLMLITSPANAHPPEAEDAPKTLEDALSKKSDGSLSLKDSLPSEDQIEDMIAELPDFNHLMDGLIKIAQDETVREQLADSAAHMKEQFEDSGALELRDNGLPDINTGLEVLLRSLSDRDGIGGMLDALEGVGDELETVMKESLDTDSKKD